MNQSLSPSRRRSLSAPCVVLCWLCLTTQVAAQGATSSCSHPHQPEFYSQGNYRVREVYIKSPFGLVAHSLAALKPDLPLQRDSAFSLNASSAGRRMIEARLQETEKNADQRLRIRVVLAEIDNCHESDPRQLDVIYWVITTDYNSYFSHTWEFKNDESARPAASTATASAAAGRTRSLLTISPYAGYNRTRQLFGGGQARLRLPGGVFESLDLNASGSPAGSIASLDLSGAWVPGRTALNRLEYRLGYRHVDLPADNNRLRQGVMQLQFFGATKPLGDRNLVVRFGAAMEGGNQQTDLTGEANTVHSLASSGYGALKTYLGATLRTERYAIAGSYGMQLATRGATVAVDFVKHVGDLALTARWLPVQQKPGEAHKALTLEAQLSGGSIRTLGRTPVTERFFGGNAAQYFISGDNWRIRSGPFIRSIPQNRMGGAVGGTRFYSVNLTVARPVWGYPMIPKEMAADPEFTEQWQGAQDIAQSALTGTYLNKFPESFAGIITYLAPVEAAMAELKVLFNSLPDDPPDELPSNLRGQYQRTLRHVTNVRALIGLALKEKAELPSKLEALLKEKDSATCMGPPLPPPLEDEDVEDDKSEDQITCSQLTRLRFELGDLAGLLRQANLTAEADKAEGVQAILASRQIELIEEFKQIDKSGAQRMAEADMEAVKPILKAIKDEINLLAVSPVAIFDLARLWPDRNGTRFGLGGGVRVTVVNFNVTLGYAFNPNPRPREGRGAFFFSMEVTDLFR